MHISWLGQTCVRLQTKYKDEDVVTIIDPYRPETGEFPRNLSPQIALFSNGAAGGITLSQGSFVIDTLGECEIKEVMITAFPSLNGNLVFKIVAEQLSVVHLGKLNKKPDIADLEKIGHVDILLLPVGNSKEYLSAEDATNLLAAIEPRIVIPIAYQCDTDKNARPVAEFVKESGLKPDLADKKVIIKKKDLPQEDTKLFILEKNV